MNKKSKTICLLDSEKYFVKLQTVFFNKRTSNFSSVENGYDIQKPDLSLLRGDSQVRAKWNENSSTWSYETPKKKIEIKKEEKSLIEDVMYYVRVIRNQRLHESDGWLLSYNEKKKDIPKSLQEYRQKLRDIPNDIVSKKISEPKLIDRNSILNFANAENYIEFKWPEKPKLEL